MLKQILGNLITTNLKCVSMSLINLSLLHYLISRPSMIRKSVGLNSDLNRTSFDFMVICGPVMMTS